MERLLPHERKAGLRPTRACRTCASHNHGNSEAHYRVLVFVLSTDFIELPVTLSDGVEPSCGHVVRPRALADDRLAGYCRTRAPRQPVSAGMPAYPTSKALTNSRSCRCCRLTLDDDHRVITVSCYDRSLLFTLPSRHVTNRPRLCATPQSRNGAGWLPCEAVGAGA
jgi:hypothetical protein